MRSRRWLAVAVADALVAVGGGLLLIALTRAFGSSFTLAPQPSSRVEDLLVLIGLTLVLLAPLVAARITGNPTRTGVAAAVAGLIAVWLGVLLDPQAGGLMPLALGMGVAALVSLAGANRRQVGARGVAVLVVAGLAMVVSPGIGQAIVVLFAFPAVALADYVGPSSLTR